MKTVIVSGALANKPGQGGEAWVRLNWVLGFRELGWKVYFIEEIASAACRDTEGRAVVFAASVNRAYFERVIRDFGLEGSASLICDQGAEIFGADAKQLANLAARSELLVNISGHLRYEPVFARVKRRIYVDIDPGFTQFWTAQGNSGAHLEGHDQLFTIGENIGLPDCPIPTCGRHWLHTRPPIVLSQWPVVTSPHLDRFTTIANWRGPFGPVTFAGTTYGLKVHEFRKILSLPQRTGQRFGMALNIHPADGRDLDALSKAGWEIENPVSAAGDPNKFRDFIQRSAAEFSVSQGIYAQTRSGWFSDRTAAYLATGKPALVQDTGFSRHLPVGDGLVPFHTVEEAANGAIRIAADYTRHCHAARAIAEEHFDSRRVIARFLENI